MRIFQRPHAMTAHGMTLALVVAMVTVGVQGNGYMFDPPARQMLRTLSSRILDCLTGGATQLSQPGLSCGGAKTQAKNGGKCSACGDNYSAPYPRTHDLSGPNVRDQPFPRAYLQAQTLTVAVDITVAQKGAFEVRLCPLKEGTEGPDDLTQCYLDPEAHYVLRMPTGATSTAVTSTGMYYMEVMLPPAVNCPDGCNMQWWYRTGNTWGCDASGQCGQGFGDQEHFVNCADVRILNCQQYNAMTEYCKGASPQLAHCATMTADGQTDKGRRGPEVDMTRVDFSFTENCAPCCVQETVKKFKASLSPFDEWCENNCAMGNCSDSHWNVVTVTTATKVCR